jgi:streptomycin 6-kinase
MVDEAVPPDPFARQHSNWAQWFGSGWRVVRAATAARAQAAMERWELSDVEPFGSGGVGYVYRARLRTGEAVVLKVEPAASSWTPDAVDRALVVWARAGLAPRVIATRDDGRTLLLELVTPGTLLGACARSSEQSFAVVADVARKLRAAARATTDGPFPTISEHAEAEGWRPVLERRHPEAVAELDVLLALPATSLIHNDLYQENVLRAGNSWVVIDPKPVLADPRAECFALLAAAAKPVLADPRAECFALLAAAAYVTDLAVLERYAQAADMPDPQLLARWARVRAMITTAQRSESAEPTSDSAQWDAHLQASRGCSNR